MRSLTTKLTLVVLGVSLLSVALVFFLARWMTVREFDRFVMLQVQADFIERVTEYYKNHGHWEGVHLTLPRLLPKGAPSASRPDNGAPPPPGPERAPFALLDQKGCVVVPAGRYRLRDCAMPIGREPREDIVIGNQKVGTVVAVNRVPGLNPLESAYLARTNRAILWSAVGAAGLAVLLGLWIARTLIRPLHKLMEAIQAMAAGDLKQEVSVKSQDELGRLAAAFNQMSADLDRANQARRQMTADIAHELRNPLMVIIGYLEAMRDEILKPTPERLATLYDEAQHLQRLVADLRTLSLADAGELTLQRETILVDDLLLRVRNVWQSQAEQKQIALDLDTPFALPTVNADPERLMQVLNNLVSNALRHTPAGGRVLLAAHTNANRVHLTIQDSGEGIPLEALPFVFERFYRADPARRQSEGASGLGLAIARSIVIAHGGEIKVESTPGAGATFVVSLKTR